jgi:transcriptional regulator with XRE-family HTH domain
MFSRNLKLLREQADMTQMQFSSKIGINRSTIADYEVGSSQPRPEVMRKIAQFFNVTIDELLGEIVGKTDNQNGTRVLAVTLDSSGNENIEFIPHKAQAGYTRGYSDVNYIKSLDRFKIPKLPQGTHRAFEIIGDSMHPIESGSIVIGLYVEKIQDIRDDSRYILLTNEGIVFKRVKRKIRSFELVSDNLNYQPYSVPYADIIEMWAYVSCISFNESSPRLTVDSLLDRLNSIDSKIDLLVNH